MTCPGCLHPGLSDGELCPQCQFFAFGILPTAEATMPDAKLSIAIDALRSIAEHRGSAECHAIFKGDCEEVMEETARYALKRIGEVPAFPSDETSETTT